MKAQILNTETGAVLNFQYLTDTVDLSGHDSNLVAVQVPAVPLQALIWNGNQARTKRIRFILAGNDAQSRLKQFKDLQTPIPEKYAPPVCRIDIGGAVRVRCVVRSVEAQAELTHFDHGKPTRITVNLNYIEVPIEAVV